MARAVAGHTPHTRPDPTPKPPCVSKPQCPHPHPVPSSSQETDSASSPATHFSLHPWDGAPQWLGLTPTLSPLWEPCSAQPRWASRCPAPPPTFAPSAITPSTCWASHHTPLLGTVAFALSDWEENKAATSGNHEVLTSGWIAEPSSLPACSGWPYAAVELVSLLGGAGEGQSFKSLGTSLPVQWPGVHLFWYRGCRFAPGWRS